MKKYLLLIFVSFLISCTKAGEHYFKGDVVVIRWAGEDFIFLSKEETRDMAINFCKQRFNSETVSYQKRIFGGGEDWDFFKCDAEKANLNLDNKPQNLNTVLEESKKKCIERGKKEGTEEFGECVLRLSK